MKGRIVNIEKQHYTGVYIKQGVKGVDQHKYTNYSGGNGTYVIDSEYYGTKLSVTIYFYDIGESVTYDVYDAVLKTTNKKRISSKLYNEIESHNGEKIDVTYDESIDAFNIMDVAKAIISNY